MSERVRVFRVMRPDMGNVSWISRDWETIADAEFDGAEAGDRITVEVAYMTEQELEKLPEFEGW